MSEASTRKLAENRLRMLQFAQTLGNVSEACRKLGVSRSQFYEYKKRFETQGLDGLKDLPTVHKSHPQTTPPEVVEQMLEISHQEPGWGCQKLSAKLKQLGFSVSAVTVQDILSKHGLGTRSERLYALEKRHLQDGVELTEEQVRLLERHNPSFRERHIESSRSGELLSADTSQVAKLAGVGKVVLHALVDTYGSYAFGILHTTKKPEPGAFVLNELAIPFYREHGLEVAAVITDNGREFCGTEAHPYELMLALNDIEHRRTPIAHPQSNGFVERFIRTAKEEFFQPALRRKIYQTVDELQDDFEEWLVRYNSERPHLGYRNMGACPIQTVLSFSLTVQSEG